MFAVFYMKGEGKNVSRQGAKTQTKARKEQAALNLFTSSLCLCALAGTLSF
jgi:hypothetical protein